MGGAISAIIFLIIIIGTVSSIIRQVKEQQQKQMGGGLGQPRGPEYKASPEEVRQFLEQLLGEEQGGGQKPLQQQQPPPPPPRPLIQETRSLEVVEPDVVMEKPASVAADPYEQRAPATVAAQAPLMTQSGLIIPDVSQRPLKAPEARSSRRGRNRAASQSQVQTGARADAAPRQKRSPRGAKEVAVAKPDKALFSYDTAKQRARVQIDVRHMDLRKAIVFFEIFGPPKSMRGEDSGLPERL
ncbi:MAG TPA: hypothetical protein PL033_16390 [Candidatus Brocadiia bacterium]|nr:hypothetical protein [Candidatus Brocadiia bacterium]